MKKKMWMTLAALGACALFTGCGSEADKTSESDNGEKKELIMWGSLSGTYEEQIDTLVDWYNESQDEYELKYVVQENVEEKLMTGTLGGEIPDVILWDRFRTSTYAQKNVLLPLNDYIEKDDIALDDFVDAATEEMNFDDNQYGIPVLVDNRCLFYNKALLEEAGVEPPTTWAEMLEAAKATTKWDGNTLSQAGFSLDDVGLFNMWIQQAGGWMVDEKKDVTAFNDDSGKAVLDFWDDILNESKVYQLGFNGSTDQFAAGKVAMMYNTTTMMKSYDEVDGLDYGVVEPLRGDNGDTGATMGGYGLVIPEKSGDKEAAWSFIKWWTGDAEVQKNFTEVSDYLPGRKDALQELQTVERYAPFAKAMDYARTRSSLLGYSNVEKLCCRPQFENFVAGKISAAEALKAAEEEGNKILEEN